MHHHSLQLLELTQIGKIQFLEASLLLLYLLCDYSNFFLLIRVEN